MGLLLTSLNVLADRAGDREASAVRWADDDASEIKAAENEIGIQDTVSDPVTLALTTALMFHRCSLQVAFSSQTD